MILLWFSFLALKRAYSAFTLGRSAASFARRGERLLHDLGRQAWDLRKQHVGMEDILGDLGRVETEIGNLGATVAQVEEELYQGDSMNRRLRGRLRDAQADLGRAKRAAARHYVLFGKALDASRHHDAALVDYYRRISENAEHREKARRDTYRSWMRLFAILPFAVIEWAVIAVAIVSCLRVGGAFSGGYHVVFRENFQSGAEHWTKPHARSGSLEVSEGALRLRSTLDRPAKALLSTQEQSPKVGLRLEVLDLSPGAIGGIVFNSGTHEEYILEFRADHMCRLAVYKRGRQDYLTPWRGTPPSDVMASELRVEVRCAGQEVFALINGRLALSRAVFEPEPGYAGLYVSPNGELRVASFDVGYHGLSGWLTKVTGRR